MQAGSEGGTPAIREVGVTPAVREIGSAGSGELGPKVGPEAAGLAKGLEATLGTPDIGIKKTAEANVPDIAPSPMGAPEVSPLNKPPGLEVPEPEAHALSGVEDVSVPAGKPETPDVNKPTGELKPPTETEALAQAQEASKVPGKLASDPEYIKIVGEHYYELKQKGGEINRAQIDQITKQSISEYYDKGAKAQVEKGLPDEIKKDPLYQQKLGEALTNAQDKGELLDANKLSQEAVSKYQQEKDLKAEEAAGSQGEQPTTDERLEDVAQRLSDLLKDNEAKLESAKVTISAKDLALLLKALAEGKEPDKKKKESMLMLLLKLLGALVVVTVTEAGNKAGQETTRQTR